MEMEQRTPLITKNLWRIMKTILYTMNKSLPLPKTTPCKHHLHTILKRSTKLAGKAIGNLLPEHQTLSSALTCHPTDIHTTFITPIEYEFSFTNTPASNYNFYTKRRTKTTTSHRFSAGSGGLHHRRSRKVQKLTVGNVRKAFEILNDCEPETVVVPEKSPLTMLVFGESPNVRRLRVTDSPFPVDYTAEESIQVDKAAEEFIKKFYVELMEERKRAAVEGEPPSPFDRRRWGHVR